MISKRIIIKCDFCQNILRLYPYRFKKTKKHFCNKKCQNESQIIKIEKKCKFCNNIFYIRPSENKKYVTCNNKECRQKNKQKENNPRWKNGSTKTRKASLTTKEYKIWRKSVFERDNYTCQHPNCIKHGGYLEAHHIKPWTLFPESRYDINNGLTLCTKHHRETFKEVWNYDHI